MQIECRYRLQAQLCDHPLCQVRVGPAIHRQMVVVVGSEDFAPHHPGCTARLGGRVEDRLLQYLAVAALFVSFKGTEFRVESPGREYPEDV